MNPVSSVFILLGALVALLAGVGLLTFNTPYARFHAAGKASPIAFLLVAIGAGIEVGLRGAAELAIVAAALLLTLPASTHLLFRATHRTTDSAHLSADALAEPERELAQLESLELDAHTADTPGGDTDGQQPQHQTPN
jgi:multicomponent Na+:H+ antiporter subunit G